VGADLFSERFRSGVDLFFLGGTSGQKKKYFASHHPRASLPRVRIKTIDAPLEVHFIEEIKGFPTVVEFCV